MVEGSKLLIFQEYAGIVEQGLIGKQDLPTKNGMIFFVTLFNFIISYHLTVCSQPYPLLAKKLLFPFVCIRKYDRESNK